MRRVRLSILLATLLTIGLLAAAPASAGTVCAVGNVATFLASDVAAGCPGGTNTASEVNSLTVSTTPAGDIVFTDANKPITDGDGGGTGCSVSGNTATCPGTLAYTFNLGAGDDSATVGAVANGGLVSTGGDGNDELHGGPLGDVFDGGPGNDVLDGGGGNDLLHGGDGTDTMDGGAGADALMGGAGDDIEHGGEDNDTLD